MSAAVETKKTNPRREELKALSMPFKIAVKEGIYENINDGLCHYYAEQGHKTLKTFNDWNKDGYKITKGAKALLLWGSPKPYKQAEATDEESETSFFPVCYVFSNLQVELRNEN